MAPWIVGVLAVGFLAVVGLRVQGALSDRSALAATLKERPPAAHAGAVVETVRPKPSRWRPRIPVTGTLVPAEAADIGFETGGRLQSIRVKVGDRVTRGQLLATLDGAGAAAQAAAAAAAVRAAEAGLAMATYTEQQTAALFERQAVADAELTRAKDQKALAVAQLDQARATARLASVGVGNGSLTAPFAGLVTRAPSGVGRIVSPGEPLFRLEDTSVLELHATLTEADARLVQVGATLGVDAASATPLDKNAPPGAAPGAQGRLTALLGSLDPQTRRVPLVGEIPNTVTPPLLGGSFVRATVVATEDITVLTLPATALRRGAQDEVVTVVNGKAHLVRVAFSAAPDGTLLVRGGLTEKDDVVLNASADVREGDPLHTRAAR